MLKKRIIPIQLLMNNRLVKTKQFDSYRDVGNPVTSSKVYSDQDADELIFLNIDRTNRNPTSLLPLLKEVSEQCFMPLAVGGGITTFEHAEQLIRGGADKVVLNSIAYQDLKLITAISSKFGKQAVVISIDAKKGEQDYELYSNCGREKQAIPIETHIANVVQHGAGEIFINSIEQDGTMTGYDLELIARVVKATSLPVIGCGGAGQFAHLKEAFLETQVNALACGSLFSFGDNNPIRAKAYLSNYGLQFKVI